MIDLRLSRSSMIIARRAVERAFKRKEEEEEEAERRGVKRPENDKRRSSIGRRRRRRKEGGKEKIDEFNRITSPSRWMAEARTEGKVRGEPRPELLNKDDRESIASSRT